MRLQPILLAAPLLALGACSQPEQGSASAPAGQEVATVRFAISGMT